MARLVALFADPDQYICSIYDLEKRVKKKADKKRKKLSAIPPWDLSVIESLSISSGLHSPPLMEPIFVLLLSLRPTISLTSKSFLWVADDCCSFFQPV